MKACIITSDPSVSHVIQTIQDLKSCGFADVITSEAVDPKDADTGMLSSYGKFLMFGCRARHTHFHYERPAAFACALAHAKVFELCVESREPFLILEDNCSIVDFSELNECCRIFLTRNMHLLLCHTVFIILRFLKFRT